MILLLSVELPAAPARSSLKMSTGHFLNTQPSLNSITCSKFIGYNLSSLFRAPLLRQGKGKFKNDNYPNYSFGFCLLFFISESVDFSLSLFSITDFGTLVAFLFLATTKAF